MSRPECASGLPSKIAVMTNRMALQCHPARFGVAGNTIPGCTAGRRHADLQARPLPKERPNQSCCMPLKPLLSGNGNSRAEVRDDARAAAVTGLWHQYSRHTHSLLIKTLSSTVMETLQKSGHFPTKKDLPAYSVRLKSRLLHHSRSCL